MKNLKKMDELKAAKELTMRPRRTPCSDGRVLESLWRSSPGRKYDGKDLGFAIGHKSLRLFRLFLADLVRLYFVKQVGMGMILSSWSLRRWPPTPT